MPPSTGSTGRDNDHNHTEALRGDGSARSHHNAELPRAGQDDATHSLVHLSCSCEVPLVPNSNPRRGTFHDGRTYTQERLATPGPAEQHRRPTHIRNVNILTGREACGGQPSNNGERVVNTQNGNEGRTTLQLNEQMNEQPVEYPTDRRTHAHYLNVYSTALQAPSADVYATHQSELEQLARISTSVHVGMTFVKRRRRTSSAGIKYWTRAIG